MKSLRRTITVFVIICLSINGFAHAQATESDLKPTDDSGEPLITEDFLDEDLGNVLYMISDITGVNIMFPDTAKGAITCKLKEQPLNKALEIILAATPYIAIEKDGYYLVTLKTSQKLEISGAVGPPGVVMNGLPGNPVTDSSGRYSATVDFGWAGNVKPFKEGYNFSPPMKVYSAVTENQTNQNYRASVFTFIISGRVGVTGVRMRGLPGEPVTGPNGSYSATVAYGWFGTVTPQKEGFDFDPPQIMYENISMNLPNQDYTAALLKYTISGSIGISNVIMRGFPGTVVSDRNGSYRTTVEHGWSGTVTPEKEGYTFEPTSRTYANVTSDRRGDSYVVTMKSFTISGTILSDKGEPVKGVKLLTNSGDSIVTDEDGRYYFSQEYGWSGSLTPFQDGYAFTPKFRQYRNINRDQTNQNYKAEVQMLTISDVVEAKGQPVPGVEVITSNGETVITDSRGQFEIEVPYDWSGEITLSKPGIEFNPPRKTYTNVTTDIINGIPVQRRTTMGAAMQEQTVLSTQISRTGTGRMLIVPAEDIESQEVTATREDMQVMAEILDERFREPRMIEGIFRDFGDFFGRDNHKTEAVYIQGYGVIFMRWITLFHKHRKLRSKPMKKKIRKVTQPGRRQEQEFFHPAELV